MYLTARIYLSIALSFAPFIAMAMLIGATGGMLIRTRDVSRQVRMFLVAGYVACAVGCLLTLAFSSVTIAASLPIRDMWVLLHALIGSTILFYIYALAGAACFVASRAATKLWLGVDRKLICIGIAFCCLSYIIFR